MNVAEVAAMLGTTPRAVRRRLRHAGIKPDDGGGYVLAQCDVDAITGSVAVADPCRLPDDPGLPLSALGDPAMREAFTMLRFQREHRLMDLVASTVNG
ncbi:hypothetical protein QSJ18_16555, partial [Gordonia sp. ABSL1-1]|uniref:hypothetical protein n=1 Tax=Gordonia sp. ABSL1-1 TaxID=3053923 RepID=UPI00257383CB